MSLSIKWRAPGRWAALTSLPRPSDSPRGYRPGYAIDRVVIFGTGPAVGWGVTTHELALPGTLAREVSARTHRGSDVDLIADVSMTAAEAIIAVREHNWARYDAIVVVLGVTDALRLTAPRVWRARLSKVLAALLESSSVETSIVVVGIPPNRSIPVFQSRRGAVTGRHARLLNHETEDLCAEHDRTTFVSLPAQSDHLSQEDRHRTAGQYGEWATVIADSLVPLLNGQRHPDAHREAGDAHREASPLAEPRTVDGMALPVPGTNPHLQQIVLLAQQAFKVETASITVLDDDHVWQVASTGANRTDVQRKRSFCESVIQGTEALIVLDAQQDERFHDHPLVTGDPYIRFYAGFPLDSPSGNRIGALTLTDTQPRLRSDGIDVTSLRALAHLAERELWRADS